MELDSEQRELELGALRDAPPAALLNDPIEYIFAEHFRQRTLCAALDEIATSKEIDRDLIKAALDFLKGDFGLHILDEETDLFPLLQENAPKDADFLDILKQLHQEHDEDRIDAKKIAGFLEDCLNDENASEPGAEEQKLLQRFAANERQHLITENAIVLPIARAALSQSDLMELGRKMAIRRGVELDAAE